MSKTAAAVAMIILGSGSLIFLLQVAWETRNGRDPETAEQGNLFILPWLFGMAFAGGYLAWWWLGMPAAMASAASWLMAALFISAGALAGLMLAMVGLISDPRGEPQLGEQFATTLVFLSIPTGLVIGTAWRRVWLIPGPLAGFCLGPLVMLAVVSLADRFTLVMKGARRNGG